MEEITGSFRAEEPGSGYQPKQNIVLERSFDYAVRIVKFYRWLYKNHGEIAPLAKQNSFSIIHSHEI